MGYLKIYTGKAVEDTYANSMANAVHFSYSYDGVKYEPLNQGYGILYAKADIREDNTLAERGVIHPKLYKEGETYYIVAENVDGAGNSLPIRKASVWMTSDFVSFSQPENIEIEEAELRMSQASDTITISGEQWERIKDWWIPIQAVDAGCITEEVNELSQLCNMKAKVTYSDGSFEEKNVKWKVDNLTPREDGSFLIEGTIKSTETNFPLAVGYADPVIFPWKGEWYFLATNDNVNDIGLFVRKAHTVEELFEQETKEYCILEYDKERGFCQTFWAPEFHEIGGELYILFAVSGEMWGPQCHMMRLRSGGRIEAASDWETPMKVLRKDGSFLAQDGITLDMTYFEAGGKSYLCWSYRHGIGTPKDTGSMLYIATTSKECPWQLTSEPMLLSRPLYGWENNSGTINNEGPYALLLEDKVFLAYSGGDACGYTYVVGYLMASTEDDLLEVGNWKKCPAPVLHSGSVEGIQGPGHNSFFLNDQGELMIAYHSQERDKYHKRCSAYHHVHISKNGFPFLNVVGERDVPKSCERVKVIYRPL